MCAQFYNPYMKKPDYAQGMNEMMNQLMMMYLVGMLGNKTPGNGIQGSASGQVGGLPMGNPSAQALPPSPMQNNLSGQAGFGIGGGAQASQGLNLQNLLQMLRLQGMGGLGGMI